MRANTILLTACIGVSLSIGCLDPASESTPEGPSDPTTQQMAAPHGIVPWVDPQLAQAATTGHLIYYGGRVVSNMQVVQVLWGTGSYLSNVTSTATPSMATFYQQALNSDYVAWLDHDYNTVTPSPTSGTAKTNQHIGAGSFAGQYTITPSVTGMNITDTQIQSEISAQIGAGHLPAPTMDAAGNSNTYYAVFFPNGFSIRQGTSRSCQAGGFCAYHGTISNVGGREVYYGVHPDMQPGSGCDTGCGSAPTPFGNYTSVASHEMVETMTDGEVGLASVVGPPLAWYDTTNGEIGDICNANQGTFVGGDGFMYVIQNEWSNSQNACIARIPGITFNDFSISASPGSGAVVAGGSASATISTAITAGGAQSVSLSVTGAPAGVTASLSPTSVTSGGSSTLSITTSTAAAAGTYLLTITGTAASGSHTTSYALTITSDFSISAGPASGTVVVGGSASSTISTATTAGSAQSIDLAVSGAPAGVTASVSPTPVTSGGSATLSITAASTAAPGTYTLTVTGTAASGAHTTTYTLTVEAVAMTGITVSPATATIVAGLAKQLKATANYNDGSTVDVTTQVAWSSSNTAVATIGSGGRLRAIAPGTATITAAKNGFSGTMSVTVTAPVLLSITVTPNAPWIVTGSTQAFTATGKYNNGSLQDVTGMATWASGTTAVATMSGNVATAVATGSSKITATIGSVTSSTTLTVTATPLVSIAVTPASVSVPVGYNVQLVATGTFGDGSKTRITGSAVWSSSSTSVATVSNTTGKRGLATSVSAGTATITATLNGITGTATFTGTTATLASITVTPSAPTVAVGATQPLTATAHFSDASQLDVTLQVTWSSSDTAVATVGTAGRVKGVAAGTATISATRSGIVGTSDVTVP